MPSRLSPRGILRRLLVERELELVESHEALVESERRHRTFVDQASVGIALTTPDGDFVSANQALSRILGYDSPEDLLSSVPRVRDLYVDRETRLMVFESLDRTGRYEGPLVWRRKDGSSADLHAALSGVRDDDGRLTGIEGFATDMTELRRTAAALTLSEAKYRDLVELSPVGVCETTVDGRIAFANQSLARMFGYPTPEALIEAESRFENHLANPELLQASMRKLARDGRLEDRVQCLHRDGHTIEAQASSRAIFDPQGQLVGMQTVLVDLTALVRSYDELDAFKAKYRQLSERTLTGIGRTVPDGRIVEANASIAKMLGYDSPGEVLEAGVNLADLYTDPQERAAMLEALHESGQFEGVIRVHRKDTRPADFRISVQGVFEDGELTAIDGFVTDVTDLKTAERAALRAQREAEVARGQAEEANRAKSEFVSRISHELRTPLSAVLGFAQLLEMRELPDADERAVQGVLNAGRHLSELINDILDLSAVESGQVGFTARPVQVAGILDDAVAMVGPAAAARGIHVHLERPSPGLHAVADRQRMRQVLLNLLENAVKYNRDEGAVSVRCGTQNGEVSISVADTGVGIAQEHLSRLFRPFDRTHSPPGTTGTGLGLSVSKALVGAMNGTITVESNLGLGSTFTVLLPKAAEGAPSVEPPAPVGRPTIERPCTILYIEDNTTIASLTQEVFAGQPEVEVLIAPDGVAGIEAASNRHPDVILLDLSLPDIDGRDVLRLLGRKSETKDIPVIIVSADAHSHGIKQLLAAGAFAYITKPFEISELMAVINRALGGTDAAQSVDSIEPTAS